MNSLVYAVCKEGSYMIGRLIWRMRTLGVENVPASGPVIIACNHASNLDPPLLGSCVPRPVVYMAKQQLFAMPVVGPLITALGAFPVDRSRGDVAAIKAGMTVLRAGDVLGIFPEGGRNADRAKPPQSGVALLASSSGAPVVPTYIDGTAHPSRLGRISVVFGEPLRFEAARQARREAMANWSTELMERIYGLRERL